MKFDQLCVWCVNSAVCCTVCCTVKVGFSYSYLLQSVVRVPVTGLFCLVYLQECVFKCFIGAVFIVLYVCTQMNSRSMTSCVFFCNLWFIISQYLTYNIGKERYGRITLYDIKDNRIISFRQHQKNNYGKEMNCLNVHDC